MRVLAVLWTVLSAASCTREGPDPTIGISAPISSFAATGPILVDHGAGIAAADIPGKHFPAETYGPDGNLSLATLEEPGAIGCQRENGRCTASYLFSKDGGTFLLRIHLQGIGAGDIICLEKTNDRWEEITEKDYMEKMTKRNKNLVRRTYSLENLSERGNTAVSPGMENGPWKLRSSASMERLTEDVPPTPQEVLEEDITLWPDLPYLDSDPEETEDSDNSQAGNLKFEMAANTHIGKNSPNAEATSTKKSPKSTVQADGPTSAKHFKDFNVEPKEPVVISLDISSPSPYLAREYDRKVGDTVYKAYFPRGSHFTRVTDGEEELWNSYGKFQCTAVFFSVKNNLWRLTLYLWARDSQSEMMHYKKVDGKWKSANEKKPVNSVYTADIMESEQNSSVPKPVLSLESVVTIPNPEKKGKNISTGTMYDKNADDLAIATEEDLPTGGALAKKAPALFSGAPPPVPRSPNTLDILNPDPETIDILEHEVNGVTIKKFDPKDIKITVLVEGPSVIGEYECTSVEFVFNDEIAVLRFKAKYGNAEPSYVYREKVEGEWRMTSRTVFDRRCREMDVDLSILSKPNVPQVEEVAPAPSKWNRLIFWR